MKDLAVCRGDLWLDEDDGEIVMALKVIAHFSPSDCKVMVVRPGKGGPRGHVTYRNLVTGDGNGWYEEWRKLS